MKKLYKVLLYVSISIVLIATVFFYSAKYFSANNWKNYYTAQEMSVFADSINSAPSLSTPFYKAYELVYPDYINRKISQMENKVIWNILTRNNSFNTSYRQCSCVLIANLFENRFPIKYHSFSALFLAHGLEQNASELKCFDYLYSKDNFIKDISIEFFDKPINQLTFNESLKLILFESNPTRYRNNPDELMTEVNNYLKKAAHNIN